MFNALLGTKITLAGDFVCLLLPSHKWNFIHVLSMILCCCCLFVYLAGRGLGKVNGKVRTDKANIINKYEDSQNSTDQFG